MDVEKASNLYAYFKTMFSRTNPLKNSYQRRLKFQTWSIATNILAD
jgi:hypothetical protein